MRIFSSMQNLGVQLKEMASPPKVRKVAQTIAQQALRAIAALKRVVVRGWNKVTRQVTVGADQTINAAKVVYDVLFPASPLNVGIEVFEKVYKRLPIDGDGHCCFRALAYGMLYNIQQNHPNTRESTVRNVIASAKEKLHALAEAESAEVRALSTAENIQATLGSLEQALIGFVQHQASDASPEELLQWVNDKKEAHFIVVSLRTLCSLYGLYLSEQNSPEQFVPALKDGSLGIEANSVEDYAEKMLNADTESAPIRFGGHIEIEGFGQLFSTPVRIFSLNSIGAEHLANYPLSPAQLVERNCSPFGPAQGQFPLPILLVHHRIHYDAAVALPVALPDEVHTAQESPRADEPSTASEIPNDRQDSYAASKLS